MRPLPLTLALVMVASLAAQRGDRPQRGDRNNSNPGAAWQQISQKYDADKDGKITAEELGRGDRAFGNLDTNRDGNLTAEDFANSGRSRGRGRGQSQMMIARVVRNADNNEDGAVTEAEWQGFVAQLSKDEDGVISVEAIAKLMPQRRGAGRRGGGGGGRGDRRGGGMNEMFIRMLDRNDDGKLESTDLMVVFTELDSDQDKQLKGDEMGRGQRGRGNRQGGRGNRQGGRGNRPPAPEVGDMAPDFDLPFAKSPKDLEKTVKLSSYAGKKPVAPIFGSYT